MPSNYTGRVKACWKVDEGYMAGRPRKWKGKDLYLCVTDMLRVVMVDWPVVEPSGYDENPEGVQPLSHTPNPQTRICNEPLHLVHEPHDFASWVGVPCLFYIPRTCYCIDSRTGQMIAYLAPSDAGVGGCRAPYSKWACTEVDARIMTMLLMYPMLEGVRALYRYIVTVGPSAAYVAPFPPSPAVAKMFAELAEKKEILGDHLHSVLEKYDGRIPSVYDFLSNTLTIGARHVFPEGVPPGVSASSGQIPVQFSTAKVAAFNFYPIGRKRFHSVLVLWYEKNWVAYAVAKACWEMKRDIVVPLCRLVGKDAVSKAETEHPIRQPVMFIIDHLDRIEKWGWFWGED